MKTAILILTLTLAAAGFAWAAEGDSLWSQTYGSGTYCGTSVDWLNTDDQGQVIFTSALSLTLDPTLWLYKVNQQGQVLWSRTYDDSGDGYAVSLLNAEGGGYLLGGRSDSNYSSNIHIWLVRTDAQGDSQWSHEYGWEGTNSLVKMLSAADGGYLLAGYGHPEGSPNTDMEVIRIDEAGDTLWTFHYGEPSPADYLRDAVSTPDGGWLILGDSDWQGTTPPPFTHAVLIRLNAQGDTLWTRSYGGQDRNWYVLGYKILPATDGGYLLNCCRVNSDETWLVRVNSQGDTLWTHLFPTNQGILYSTFPMPDGCYLGAGMAGSDEFPFYEDLWLVKFNDSGDTLWTKKYGQPDLHEDFMKIIPTSDGGYLAGIDRYVDPSQGWDHWLWTVKLNAEGDTLWSNSFAADYSMPDGFGLLQGQDGNYRSIRRTVGILQNPAHLILQCQAGPASAVLPQPEMAPAVFRLDSPHPNPFNPSTAISYQLSAISQVSLKVYDTAGRLVATLVEGRQSAGTHQALFNGSGLVSGIYLLRLQAGRFQAAGKMVLLK